jgi:hypothetical protein
MRAATIPAFSLVQLPPQSLKPSDTAIVSPAMNPPNEPRPAKTAFFVRLGGTTDQTRFTSFRLNRSVLFPRLTSSSTSEKLMNLPEDSLLSFVLAQHLRRLIYLPRALRQRVRWG